MIGVLPLLGLIFITLKLLGMTIVATWSWWLVTLPLWGGLAVLIAFMAFCGVMALISASGGKR